MGKRLLCCLTFTAGRSEQGVRFTAEKDESKFVPRRKLPLRQGTVDFPVRFCENTFPKRQALDGLDGTTTHEITGLTLSNLARSGYSILGQLSIPYVRDTTESIWLLQGKYDCRFLMSLKCAKIVEERWPS